MPSCVICQCPTDRVIPFRPTAHMCEACSLLTAANAPATCPTCRQRIRRARPTGRQPQDPRDRNARHDERVLACVDPEKSWREIVRATSLRTTDAQRARDRLLVDGRLVLYAAPIGNRGGRYCLPDHPEARAMAALATAKMVEAAPGIFVEARHARSPEERERAYQYALQRLKAPQATQALDPAEDDSED